MERKRIIAIVIIAIILVGGLGWYYFFGMPREEKKTSPTVYIDAQNYTQWTLPWNFTNATPYATYYSFPHNVTNGGADDVNVILNFTAQYYNGTNWNPIYDGKRWLTRNLNITVSTVLAMGTYGPWYEFANKTNEGATYFIYFSYTDQTLMVTFQYSGDNPTIDGHTVFTYLAFDGNNNNKIDALDKAFNFTNTLGGTPYNNVLKVYTNKTDYSWQLASTYGWNETEPSDAPVTVAITSDRKTITWMIPFSLIGAEKAKYLGFAFQGFSYDWFPAGANATTLSKYNKIQLALTETNAPLTLTVPPQTTIRFYIKVAFLSRAKSGNYTFTFQPYIP